MPPQLQFQPNPYAILTAIATVISAGVAIYAFMRRQVNGALQLTLLMTATLTWSFFYTLELLASSLQAQIAFSKLAYFGIVASAPAWFLFGVTYVGQRRHYPTAFYLFIWAIPVITLLLALTNEHHHLMWRTYTVYDYGNFHLSRAQYGWWFWVHAAYSYLLLLIGSLPLMRQGLRNLRTNRTQAVILLVGILPAWTVNLIYLLGKEPLPGLDLTVFGLLGSGLVLVVGIFRYRLLDIIPIAAETILNTIHDGILVINTYQQTILQANAAVARLLDRSLNALAGQPLEAICPQAVEALQLQLQVIRIGQRWFHLSTAPIKNAPELQLLYLRDITQSRTDAEHLRQQNHFLNGLNQLTRTILSGQHEEDILPPLARQTAELLTASHAIILDSSQTPFQVLAATLPPQEARQSLNCLPVSVFQAHAPQIITQPESKIHSFLLLPLEAENITLGALAIGYLHPHEFSDEEIARGQQVADQISLALSKIRLLREMQDLALHDDLTNAYNHRFLNLSGQKLFLEHWQEDRPFSLIIFDLDSFKQINDRYGHLSGDLVLSQIARRARSQLRPQDYLVRYGGDEFIILLPDAPLETARLMAQRIKHHVCQPPIKIPDAEITPGISMGLAALSPETDSLESLIRRADHALYQGKKLGKNRIVVYGEEP